MSGQLLLYQVNAMRTKSANLAQSQNSFPFLRNSAILLDTPDESPFALIML